MSWIDRQSPPVPESFRATLGAHPDPEDVEDLVALARHELQRALDHPGRDREAAFHLLAADAFATYACEMATSSQDVAGTLRSVLDALQDGASR